MRTMRSSTCGPRSVYLCLLLVVALCLPVCARLSEDATDADSAKVRDARADSVVLRLWSAVRIQCPTRSVDIINGVGHAGQRREAGDLRTVPQDGP